MGIRHGHSWLLRDRFDLHLLCVREVVTRGDELGEWAARCGSVCDPRQVMNSDTSRKSPFKILKAISSPIDSEEDGGKLLHNLNLLACKWGGVGQPHWPCTIGSKEMRPPRHQGVVRPKAHANP